MSRLCVLLCLAACGRIAFDDVPGDGGIESDLDGGGALTLPPQVCRATATYVGVTNKTVDLVATKRTAGGFAAAWVGGQSATAPQYVSIDDSGQLTAGPISFEAGTVGEVANSLVDLGDRMYFVFHDATGSHHLAFTYDGSVNYSGAWPSVPGRDCVSRDEDGAVVWAGSNGTVLEALYMTAAGPMTSSRALYDTGDIFGALACHDGPDHVHVGWFDAIGRFRGINFDTGAPVLMPGTTQSTLSPDGTQGRTGLVDLANDSLSIVSMTASGAIESAFATNTLDPRQQLSASGSGPRTRSDGTILWFAWTELGAGQETLTIAHKTRNGPTTTVPLPDVVTSGLESYELIRDGSTVYLVVLTRDGFLRVLELCA